MPVPRSAPRSRAVTSPSTTSPGAPRSIPRRWSVRSGCSRTTGCWFEPVSRVLVTARAGREGDVEDMAAAQGVPITRLGLTGGSRIEFAGLFDVALSDVLVVYEGAIPRLMSAARTVG